MKRMVSLKHILTFNFMVVALIPLLTSGFIVYHSISYNMAKEISSKNQMLADSVARELEGFLDDPLRLLHEIQVLGNPDINIPEQNINRYLSEILRYHLVFDMVMILDDNGIVKNISPYDENLAGIDMSYQKYYLAQKNRDKPQWSQTFISAKTGRPTLTLSVPFEKGMIVGFLNLKYLDTIIQNIRLGQHGYASICDSDGTVIAHVDPTLIEERFNSKSIMVFERGFYGKEGTFHYRFQNTNKIGSKAIVPQTKWLVIITQTIDEAFAPVRHIQHIILCGMLAAVLFAIFAAYISLRMTLNPLGKLTEDTKRIAAGDYSSPLEPAAYREIVTLENSFIKMRDALQSRENALRESESRYRTLVNNMPGAVYRSAYDDVWTTEYISDGIEALCGYPPSELINGKSKVYSSLVHPHDQQMIREAVDRAIKQHRHFIIEYRIFHADGTIRWIYSQGQAIYDDSDEVLFLDGVLLDCTERKVAETALLESEEKLQITLNSIGDAVIATDMGGRIERMNPVAETLSGWNAKDAIGCLFDQVFHLIDQQNSQAISGLVSDVVKTGKPVEFQANAILISKDGQERVIANSGAPILNEKDEIVGAVLVFRDISEQAQLESRIRQSEKMESIGRLAGGVAHDFNNMLGGIIGAADLLALQIKGNQIAEEHVAIIIQAAERVADLTSKLLSFSHKGKFISKPLSVHDMINDSVGILLHSLNKRIHITTELSATQHVMSGDKSQLQNTIINLGVNASDAMPDGGELTFRTENISFDQEYCENSSFAIQPGQYIKLTVKDTGIGMDDSILAKIFEPFFTTKKEGAGTGLGLAAVYGTVKDHYGAIAVESLVGSGTEFHIYFPILDGHLEQQTQRDVAVKKLTGTILIVDDESVIRKTAVAMLEELGYTVLTAEDGPKAIQHYKDSYPGVDLVLLDMIMPNMSGPEVFREIRAFDPSAKILVSSGYSKDRAVDELKQMGAVGFIKKPYRYIELAEVLAQISIG